MPDLKRIDEIVESLRDGAKVKPDNYKSKSLLPQDSLTGVKPYSYKAPEGTIKNYAFDTPVDAIYDRLSDGTYITKFENYKGAFGNEDRLAQQQGFGEKLGYGVAKFAGKTIKNALDATVGTVVGIGNALSTGELSGIWDNDFSNKMDDWNTQMNNSMKHYYSDEEKSKGILGSMLTSNFWFNDVGDGLAFVAGALLPEIAIGTLSGGASIGVGAAKLGATATKSFIPKILGKAASKVDDITSFTKGRNIIRGYQNAIYGKKAGDVIGTGLFLARTSSFEAGMEARHNFKESVGTFMETFEGKNGRPPTMAEISKFTADAKNVANGVYGANLAVLSVSNAVMFGKAFDLALPGVGKKLTNAFNKPLGLGYKVETVGEKAGELVMRGANKAQKFTGNAYKVLAKPVTEGVFEEGLQGVIGKTMQGYLETKYDPSSTEAYSMLGGLYDSFAEQYGTKEGWKEIGIGMIIGFAGGAIQPGQKNADGTKAKLKDKLPGLGSNSRKAAETRIQTEISDVNSGITTLRGLDRASSMRNYRNVSQSKDGKFESTSAENALENVAFIQSQEHMKSPKEIKRDFDLVIDKMELSEERMSELEFSDMDINTYKTALKDEFNQNIKDYTFATKAVEALGLDRELVKLKKGQVSKGNISNIKDAMIMNIMLGKSGLKDAKNIGEQLDAIISPVTYGENGNLLKVGGIFNHLQFFNSLTDDKKEKVEELKSKQKQLKDLQDLSVTLNQNKGETGSKEYNTTAEKAVITQQQIIKLQKEVDNLSKAITSYSKSANYDIDGTLASEPQDIITTIEELDKVDNYVQALRESGKDYEAESIEYLIGQFKYHSDSHRQMMDTHRNMLATGFFQTEKGSKFIDRLVGKKYTMSSEFMEDIRNQNEVIDRSLDLAGVREYDSVEAEIKRAIEDNEELSDREKFRLESIIRMQLNFGKVADRLNTITVIEEDTSSEIEENLDPLEGDTVRLKTSLKNKELDNLEVLKEAIADIVKELNSVLNLTRSEISAEQKTALEKELAGLEEELTKMTENTESEQFGNTEQLKAKIEKIKNRLAETPQANVVGEESRKRYEELLKKLITEDLTASEVQEVTDLKDDIDQWLMISGTVTDGMRLSDLIRQKVILEETPIDKSEEIEEVTVDDLLDSIDFKEKSDGVYYENVQSPDKVTVVKSEDFVVVSGITKEAFIEESGVDDLDFETEEKVAKANGNKQRNLLLTIAEVERINAVGNISILATNADMTTNYNVVYRYEEDINQEKQGSPLDSNHSSIDNPVNADVIYGLKEGDELSFEIDPNDPWNKNLLDTYRGAEDTEEEEITIDESKLTEKQKESLEDIEEALRDKSKALDKAIEKVDLLKEEKIKLIEKEKNPTLTTSEKYTVLKAIQDNKDNLEKAQETEKDIVKNIKIKALAEFAKTNKVKSTKKKNSPAKQTTNDLKESLAINVVDKDGNFIGKLKAKRNNAQKTPSDIAFENFRDSVVDDVETLDKLLNREKVILKQKVKAKKVYPGHPTLNIVQNTDGTTYIRYKQATEQDAKKIVDIGFVENGEAQPKTQVKGIDTTFLNKAIRESKKNGPRVPFIVIEKSGRRIAYPVKLKELEKESTEEFRDVFNSNVEEIIKVERLNKMLAERGVNIKDKGNAFTSFGNSNMTEEFLEQKIAQVEAMKNYAPISEWLSEEDNMEEIITSQIMLNINMSNPLHSPKLQIDMSDVFKGQTKPDVVLDTEDVEEDVAETAVDPNKKDAIALFEEEKKKRECKS